MGPTWLFSPPNASLGFRAPRRCLAHRGNEPLFLLRARALMGPLLGEGLCTPPRAYAPARVSPRPLLHSSPQREMKSVNRMASALRRRLHVRFSREDFKRRQVQPIDGCRFMLFFFLLGLTIRLSRNTHLETYEGGSVMHTSEAMQGCKVLTLALELGYWERTVVACSRARGVWPRNQKVGQSSTNGWI